MDPNFDELIEHLHREYPDDNNARGKAFEPICKWFLETDKGYKRRFRKIWLWDDWPGR